MANLRLQALHAFDPSPTSNATFSSVSFPSEPLRLARGVLLSLPMTQMSLVGPSLRVSNCGTQRTFTTVEQKPNWRGYHRKKYRISHLESTPLRRKSATSSLSTFAYLDCRSLFPTHLRRGFIFLYCITLHNPHNFAQLWDNCPAYCSFGKPEPAINQMFMTKGALEPQPKVFRCRHSGFACLCTADAE